MQESRQESPPENFAAAKPDEQLYGALQGLRAQERALLTEKEAAKLLQDESQVQRIIEDMRRQTEALKKEDYTEADIEEMRAQSISRLFRDIRRYLTLLNQTEGGLQEIVALKQAASENPKLTKSATYRGKLRLLEADSKEREKDLEEIKRNSPEAFLGASIIELKKYAEEAAAGDIVNTPWVRKRKEEIREHLAQGDISFLYGETGTGKTEVAKEVAEQNNPNGFTLIRGYRFMTPDELYGSLQLTVTEKPDPADVPALIEEAKRRFDSSHPDLAKGASKEAHALIEQTVLGQSADPATQSEYFLGPVYDAAKNGKTVIIDEANYINPGLISSLNEIFKKARPGSLLDVPQTGEKIEVKDGFGFILTGNIASGAKASKYKDRFELDPALRDRVHLVEYNTPPQITEGTHTEEGERDLFLIGLAHVADEKGNVMAPPDSVDKVWKLSQAFKLFQDVYAGKEIPNYGKFVQGGSSPMDMAISKNHASLRKFSNIFERWNADGRTTEIDQYVYEELVQRAQDTPQEAAYYYQILQNKYGFFSSDGWDQSPNYGNAGVVSDFHPNIPQKANPAAGDSRIFSPQEIAEAMTGEKMPELSEVTPERVADQMQQELLTEFTAPFEDAERELQTICPAS